MSKLVDAVGVVFWVYSDDSAKGFLTNSYWAKSTGNREYLQDFWPNKPEP